MFSAFLVYYLIKKYSFLSRQLLQIFVHPKSSHRYLELFCLLFKLPFSYPSHPLQLFPLLLCPFFILLFPIHLTRHNCSFCYSVFFFKLLFFYPFDPSQLFPLLFCLLFKLPFFLSISPVTTVLSVILSFFILSLTSPTQSSLLFFLLLCLLLSTLSPPPHNHRYCFLCYSVSSYSVPFSLFCRTFSSVPFPCYFSSTKATFRQVLTLFFCSTPSLLSITKPFIYVFICTYFHVII